MTRRDLICRVGGAVVIAACCVAARLQIGGDTAVIPCFLACIMGIALMANGRHVLTVFRAERRGHALTAGVIHAARLRRGTGRERP